MKPSITFQDGASRLTLDFSYLPSIVFSCWEGETTVKLMAGFAAQLEALHRGLPHGARYVSISQSHGSQMSAKVRKAAADLQRKVQREHAQWRAGSVVIIESSLVRGFILAIEWLTGHSLGLTPVESFAEALAAAKRLLDEAGQPWPEGLTAAYVPAGGPGGEGSRQVG